MRRDPSLPRARFAPACALTACTALLASSNPRPLCTGLTLRSALAALRQAAATIKSPAVCRMLSTRSFLLGLLATNFAFLDVPVYWPILLAYFLFLFAFTMRRQIKHMIKHKYNPFEAGKVCCANLLAQWCHEHAGPSCCSCPHVA